MSGMKKLAGMEFACPHCTETIQVTEDNDGDLVATAIVGPKPEPASAEEPEIIEENPKEDSPEIPEKTGLARFFPGDSDL